ncbi:aldehyde dehydrogenase family protein [Pseudarthrobacter sulfonivorans]|uniref:aldehyde dehydrogenase family protein n=1 Tax=Pseudarthrobacter sulfonivorans TaxID=121292 RepID=UPI00168B1734|nr:aldehyde dehydrogenase family protein [Pseudarthrobacter sulfonivorans]
MTTAVHTIDPARVEWCLDMSIDGEPIKGLGAPIMVHNPATEQVVAIVPTASPEQVDRAVRAARRAFEQESWLDPHLRKQVILTIAETIERNAELLTAAIVTEVGTPVTLAKSLQIGEPVAVLRKFAELTVRDRTRNLGYAAGPPPSEGLIRYLPSGVVAAIAAYNYPILFAAIKIGAAVAAGCTTVLLSSPQAPLALLLLGKLLQEADLPVGVVNFIVGEAETGKALTTHPEVDKVSFTGSVGVGKLVMSQAASGLKGVALELGGKSPSLLLPDADLQQITTQVHARYLRNAGQGCSSPTRILVHQDRYDEFIDLSRSALAGIKTGDPWDPTTVAGPLISSRHRDTVEGFVQRALDNGGSIVAGGGRPSMDKGWYMNSTLIGGVTNQAEIAREELFGPVGVVLPYSTVQEAIDMANDSAYGLAATIYGDPQAAQIIAPKLRVGTVMINGWLPRQDKAGGGFKLSGIGRELGEDGIMEFLETQFVAWPATSQDTVD